tara:strand:+ start:1241 stop:1408 length:168 start_codon:yes stop_codon:yes gene_type:complete
MKAKFRKAMSPSAITAKRVEIPQEINEIPMNVITNEDLIYYLIAKNFMTCIVGYY